MCQHNVTVTAVKWKVCVVLAFCVLLLPSTHGHAHGQHKAQGKCYVIGVGPAGPEHASGKAIECLQKADIVYCKDSMAKRFASYLEGKELRDHPSWKEFKYNWRDRDKLSAEQKKSMVAERIRFWDKKAGEIRKELSEGKTIAVLDSGDPCVFAPAHRVIEGLREDEFEIIPGFGCFQAAMAVLKKSSIPAHDIRFLMLTAPVFLFETPEDESILKDLSKYSISMGLYMALKRADGLVTKLKKYYPGDLPVAVVYYAGYPNKEKVVKGTLDTILEKIKAEKENWMGMMIIGRCLEGQPQRGMVKHMAR